MCAVCSMFTFGYKKVAKRSYPDPFRMKVVVIGDNDCGKTCLLKSICIGPYEQFSYIGRVFESFVYDLTVDGVEMEIAPWDTVGDLELDHLRPLSYPDTDVILLCFSIDSQLSLQHVETKWLLEVKQFCPKVPIILIGNKKDLRDHIKAKVATVEIDPGNEGSYAGTDSKSNVTEYVTQEQGEIMAERIGAFAYLECSAKTMDGINTIFLTAGNVALQTFESSRGRRKCNFL